MFDRTLEVLKLMNASKKNDFEGIKNSLTVLNIHKAPTLLKELHEKFKYLGQSIFNKNGDIHENDYIMDDLLIVAIIHNNVMLCKYLVESKELRLNANVNNSEIWKYGISKGNMDTLNYLINSPKGIRKEEFIVDALSRCREKIDLRIIKYLIDDPTMPLYEKVVAELRKNNSTENVINRFEIFINACGNDYKEAVDFLLAHNEYKNMITPVGFGAGLNAACYNNELDMVDYLLTDKKMPFKPYLDFDPSFLLTVAVMTDSVEMMEYLVFDFNIPKTEEMNDFLRNDGPLVGSIHLPSISGQQKSIENNRKILNSLFEKRELMENLSSSLDVNSGNKKPNRKI